MSPKLDPQEIQRFEAMPAKKLRRKLRRHIRRHRAGRRFEDIVGAVTSLAIGVLLMGGLVTGLWVMIFG